MRAEVKRWLEQAERDADVAGTLFASKKYEYSSFWAQQAAEKALKTLLLKNGLELIKTHDLVLLAKKVKAPTEIIETCKQLTPVYVETRYPDVDETGFRKYSKQETEEDLASMTEVMKWVKKQL